MNRSSKEYKAQMMREFRIRHKATIAKYNKGRTERNRDYLRELKESTPCTDCGGMFPHYVMEFDHLHSKKYTVSHQATATVKALLDEIAKCEIVCANCHKVRTHERKHRES